MIPDAGAFADRSIAAVRKKLLEAHAPGASVAVLVDGEALFVEGIGFKDREQRKPLGEDARFYIYSITKTMIAVAVLQLVQQGRLALDDPVQAHVPELPLEAQITLRQLLSHRGGLPDYGMLPAYNDALRAHPQQAWSPAQFLEQSLQSGLRFAPGQGWQYSNIGYLLLKLALEAVQEAPLHVVLQEQLFSPLGLPATMVATSLGGVDSLTPGYTTMESMVKPHLVPVKHAYFQQPAYGLGLMLDPQSPYGPVAGHGGGGPGYATAAFAFPSVDGHSVICTVLANQDEPDLGLEIIYALLPLIVKEH